jgi:hypothetical protein
MHPTECLFGCAAVAQSTSLLLCAGHNTPATPMWRSAVRWLSYSVGPPRAVLALRPLHVNFLTIIAQIREREIREIQTMRFTLAPQVGLQAQGLV